MADDDEVVCPLPALRKVRHRRQLHNGTPRADICIQSTGPRLTRIYWLPLPLPHTRDPSCRAPLTRDHPQACEPRCADVFKHYLACADRIEQKGAGPGAASLKHEPPSYAIAATTRKKRAGDCEPYYFDWLKCIDKCAMPHIMQKLK